MSNVTRMPAIAGPSSAVATSSGEFRPNELQLIKRTVAADTNDDEFNVFIGYCRALRLNPLRRQIYAFVYNKEKPTKRRMSIVVAIDGLRTIADRTGAYRPDEDEPSYEIDDAVKGPSNPAGLVKATVRVHKFTHGSWHKVTASAYWTEFAPLTEKWSKVDRIDTGETWPNGDTKYDVRPAEGATRITTLDTSGKWGQMPRLMLAKCAEAAALRKAWPDDFSGVYAEEEMAQAREDLLPTEELQIGAMEDRLAKISAGRVILIDWLDGKILDPVPVGQLADRAVDFARRNAEEVSQLLQFQERNRHGLRELWAINPTDALGVKREFEALIKAAE